MTTHDAATAREEARELVEWFYRFAHVGEDAQIEKVLTFAQAQRAAVWEEAAQLLGESDVLETPEEIEPRCKHALWTILERLARKCRQQAQKEIL